MSEKYVEVREEGFGSRLGNSIAVIAMGFILFIASFFILYYNEGRTDYGKLAARSMEISSEKIDSSLEGKFVSTTGRLTGPELLGDSLYLKPGPYIALERNVEMYAWEEEKKTETREKIGGRKETVTTCTYRKGWTSSPEDSSRFKEQAGHENPALNIKSEIYISRSAGVGAWEIEPGTISLPSFSPLRLTPDMLLFSHDGTSNESQVVAEGVAPVMAGSTSITAGAAAQSTYDYTAYSRNQRASQSAMSSHQPDSESSASLSLPQFQNVSGNFPRLEGQYIYTGTGSLSSPQIGDTRISYEVLSQGIDVTVFGKVAGSRIIPYTHADGATLYRMFKASREAAIMQMSGEYTLLLWGLRALGFLLMWTGMTMFFEPIMVLLSVIPVFASIGRGLVGLVTFFMAGVLSFITIIISKILHSILALVVLAGFSVILFWMFAMRGLKRKQGAPSNLT